MARRSGPGSGLLAIRLPEAALPEVLSRVTAGRERSAPTLDRMEDRDPSMLARAARGWLTDPAGAFPRMGDRVWRLKLSPVAHRESRFQRNRQL